jgi:hypothetical protein
LIVMLRYHRFRLLGSLAAGAVVASVVLAVIVHLAGGTRPRDLAAGGGRWWLTDTSLAGAALLAATVAGTVIVAPLLGRPWRRTAWTALSLATVVLLIADTASPVEVLLAFAAGVAIGAGVLILFGAAGPTSASMSAGPAVSAVLLYRLATYWFPVVPGWLSWQVLAAGVRMKPHTTSRAAFRGLGVALAACTSSSGHTSSAAGESADRWLHAHELIPAEVMRVD